MPMPMDKARPKLILIYLMARNRKHPLFIERTKYTYYHRLSTIRFNAIKLVMCFDSISSPKGDFDLITLVDIRI